MKNIRGKKDPSRDKNPSGTFKTIKRKLLAAVVSGFFVLAPMTESIVRAQETTEQLDEKPYQVIYKPVTISGKSFQQKPDKLSDGTEVNPIGKLGHRIRHSLPNARYN